jgi:hypothetical protein
MKKSAICILAAATVLTGFQTAQAGDKETYLLGGLLGGWILNDVVGHSSVEIRRERACPPPPPVVVERHYDPRPSGRYESRQVQTWVPAHYERVSSHHGRIENRWVPGYYDVRIEQVWVSYDSNPSWDGGPGRRVSR